MVEDHFEGQLPHFVRNIDRLSFIGCPSGHSLFAYRAIRSAGNLDKRSTVHAWCMADILVETFQCPAMRAYS